jgi:outer membrane protein assembly factor BamB
MPRFVRAAVLVCCCCGPALAGNWPAWRGTDGQGHSPEKNLALVWSDTENVRWKVELPERGNSTPVVWGDRVFITQATDESTKRAVMCFARADGKLLWKKETTYAKKEPTHQTNPYCSGSPATDGERVIASLGSAGTVCYDMDGKELWRKDHGPLIHIWGNSVSPILHGDLCILWLGPGEVQTLLAVNKKNGQTVWAHDEPGGKSENGRPYVGSWSTPIIARVGDHYELLLGMPEKLKGIDPKTGKELWTCDGLHNKAGDKLVYTSPVYADGVVVAMGGFGGASMAVRAGGEDDVTESRRLWYHAQNGQRIGSPVIVGDNVYIIDEAGGAHCLELKTGKERWQGSRIPGTTWSSPVAAEGRLYVPTKEGNVVVLATGPKFEVLAKNSLGDETIMASPAISDGDIFIRSHKHLWCISAKK